MTLKSDARALILLALITVGLFANSLGGEFVYDDRRQIVANALIQTPALYGKALANDVWAFKGDGTQSTSNYWRPTFTAWSIINFRLFGLDPFGWHLWNLLLHIGACLLAYLLLRKWGLSEILAFAITLIFAVHPVHVESVAWVSGAPDLLFGIFFLASLWFADNIADKKKKNLRSLNITLAVLCYAIALGAKEVAILCFPVYYLILSRTHEEQLPNASNAVRSARFNTFGIFATEAAVYFVIRWMILGQISRPAEEATGMFGIILTAPSIFLFYVRQIIFPYWVGINYGLRPVEQADVINFFVPLLISVIVVACLWHLARRSKIQKLGIALFALPLLPVFNIRAFQPDQIVHDRYLYLSLLGFLMIVFPYIRELFEKIFPAKPDRIFLAFAVLVSIPLAIQTFLYNRVWQDQLSLWKHAITIDALSASNWSALGSELSERDQLNEALTAYNTSLEIRPAARAYIGRGQSLIKMGNIDAAIPDLQNVISTDLTKIDAYTLYQAYEALAVAYQQKNKLDTAEAVLIEGRSRLAIYRAALTERLAVILYQQNRKQDALKELEAMKGQARVELLPASKAVFLRLGLLYSEMGRREDAKTYLREYLRLTATTWDKETPDGRKQAMETLRQLK
ncbi:MAG: phospholipid carrier-dependent glycosyltransferase [Pyrinomonadaceae bacterium]